MHQSIAPRLQLIEPRHVRAVQDNFVVLNQNREAVARRFYDLLGEESPEARRLFKGNMVEQRRQFMAALGFLVMELEKPEVIVPAVKSLAVRHVAHGVEAHHYPPVGASLLRALAETLGPKFTARHREAWTAAWDALADTMIREAYPAAKQSA